MFSEIAVSLCKENGFQREIQGGSVKTLHRRSVSHFKGLGNLCLAYTVGAVLLFSSEIVARFERFFRISSFTY